MDKKSFEILKDFAQSLERAYRNVLGINVVRSIMRDSFVSKDFSIDAAEELVVGQNITVETFTKFFDVFILRFIRDFGYDFNEGILSNLYKDFQKKYKDEGDLLFLLNTLPSGTFERERLFKFSRQELEGRILDRTKQLQETNADLQKIVDERTKDLQNANKRMEAALNRLKSLDRIKSEFIGIAAHQLRTPLSAIKWTLRLVADEEMGALSATQKNFLERAYRVNEQLIELINDLLDVSRIEEGRFGYEFKEVDLMHYLRDLIDLLSQTAKLHGVNIELQKPKKNLDLITMDPERMRLVFNNIIENGIKYNHQGGKVIIALKQEKNMVHITIQDTGIGIPQTQIPQLFHKFFRADNARHLETEGTGLGLYIARIIVLRHGGQIWAESEEGKGSTFHIVLPESAKGIPSEGEFAKKSLELQSEPIRL